MSDDTMVPCDETGVPPHPSIDPPSIARVVESLPIGLTIRDRENRHTIYRNAAAKSAAALQSSPGENRRETDRIFDEIVSEIEIGGIACDVIASVDATAHHHQQQELTKCAFFDELTGLPKRVLFERSANNMIREDCAPFALSFIDLDNFKYVNDYYGHAVGDRLLQKVATRISNSMRPTDLLARVGGDEFVLLTTPIDLADPAADIEELCRRFREPFFIDGYEIFSSASIGVSIYPIHGHDYDVLRANADNAMYPAKGSTKGAVEVYDASLGHAATERMEAEQRLRLAIRDRRLGCAYQPKVDFRTNEIVGVEVLLRWLDDNGDFRAPGNLIKVALELGLMDDVALIVLDRVTSQIDLINDAFGAQASISLNIAAKQATDVAFMTKFAEALRSTGYAERFMLELTEEAFLSKGEFQRKIMPMLRSFGIRVSIDDFGVGYSSLSALAEITADELKVDRSFVTDIHRKPRNQAIVKVIELLAKSLGMSIVVEGVETFEELTYLTTATRISCGQGFYFARPIFLQETSHSTPIAIDGRGQGPRDNSRSRTRGTRAGY